MSDSYEHVLIEDQAQWRAWLDANHGTSRGIWLVTWKNGSGRPSVPYKVIVDEALAYGWVDSRPRSIDEHRSARLLTRRRPASNWSARNKARVEQLTAAGRMHSAGLAAVAAAKANGAWTALDETETLTEPADLTAALDATPGARALGRLSALNATGHPRMDYQRQDQHHPPGPRPAHRRRCCAQHPRQPVAAAHRTPTPRSGSARTKRGTRPTLTKSRHQPAHQSGRSAPLSHQQDLPGSRKSCNLAIAWLG